MPVSPPPPRFLLFLSFLVAVLLSPPPLPSIAVDFAALLRDLIWIPCRRWSTIKTVKVCNVSLGASEQDIKEFFSFWGDIEYVELHSETERSQTAYVTFKDTQGAETAVLLSGAAIVDQSVTIALAPDYKSPAAASLSPTVLENRTVGGVGSAVQKAEDIVTTMLAKGFVLGKDALGKAKSLDEKHGLTSRASAKVASLDQKIGLTEKITVGKTLVNGKMKEVDAKFQVSEKTKTALAAAEQTVSNAASAIMKNPYVLTGTSWMTSAFSRVAKAAGEVGQKTKEKVAEEERGRHAADGYSEIYDHIYLLHLSSTLKQEQNMAFLFLLPLLATNFLLQSKFQDPEKVVQQVNQSIEASRGNAALSGACRSGNPIDECWRCDPHWDRHRRRLADCAIGFGKNATGGRTGDIYIVTSSADDPVNPKPGTLRYGVIQDGPLWIIFASDMVIKLKQELMMSSFKTIDGRGANVHIADGPCISIHYVTNVIIHGVSIHDCKPGHSGYVRVSPKSIGWRTKSDGDGVSILGAKHVWVDHCSLSRCTDGLIDVIRGSTAITISNNYMTHHNKVMLLGHKDDNTEDKNMQVTIAFNHFGEGLVQRMPRCRLGYFHVVNNDYTHWEMYAIGGSASPTINSQGNRFLAPNDQSRKQVTKRERSKENAWRKWNWRSDGDLLLNGAFFVQSGDKAETIYSRASSFSARPASEVALLTKTAGALNCTLGCVFGVPEDT
ncbi:putative pectate lyase 5 [Drosera capensis]